jgi:hypothetical protein
MLKTIITSISIIVIVIGCFRDYQVDNSDNNFSINLKIEEKDNKNILEWSPMKNSAFKKYIIVSSNVDIPVGKTPSQNQILTEIFSQDQNSYIDQTISLSTQKYYKVYVDIGDRFLESNSVFIKTEIFEMIGRSTLFAFDKDSLTLMLASNNSNGIAYFDIKNNAEINTNSQLNTFFTNSFTPHTYINKPPRRIFLFIRNDALLFNLPSLSSSTLSNLDFLSIFSATNNNKYMVVTYSNGNSTSGMSVVDILNNFSIKQSYTREFPSDSRIVAFTENGSVIEVAAEYGYSYDITSTGSVANFKKHTFSKVSTVLPKIILSNDNTLFIASVSGTIYDQNFELIQERNCKNCATFAFSEDNQYLYEATKRNTNGISEIRKYNIKDNKLVSSIELRESVNILELYADGNELGIFYDRLNGRINYQKIIL